MRPFGKKNKPFEQPQKRPHHYVLAHVALRSICQQNPRGFFGIMGSPGRDDFLQDVWRQVRLNLEAQGPPTFDISDVGITTCLVKGFPAIVVTMPPPAAITEAHFVGIVLKVDPGSGEGPEHPEFAYFTLERGSRLDGTERTVLCEWTDQGSHVNYGDGPPAVQAQFIEAIEQRL